MPESATKNRVAHRVPLTERVVALLEEAKAHGPEGSRWVFAGIKGGSVAARALKAGAELARAVDENGEPLLPFSFHRHDLRRTCATNLAKVGIPRQTISRVLITWTAARGRRWSTSGTSSTTRSARLSRHGTGGSLRFWSRPRHKSSRSSDDRPATVSGAA